MCIRDSDERGRQSGEDVAEPVARRDGDDAALTVSAQRVGSVSYTHLRAHETVLDLVCRLLLEKKNITQKTPKQLHHTHITYTTSHLV